MNIFAISSNPRTCARALDDKRLIKMILETAQILCTVVNLECGTQVTPYRNSHINHPLITWADHPDNWSWLWDLGREMGEEYQYRFNKTHASHSVIVSLGYLLKESPQLPTVWYKGASHSKLGLDFKALPVFKAYREYLKARWPGDKRKPTWTRRSPPTWYQP